jgi:hypothetical protein
VTPEFSRTCGRVLASPLLDGELFDRLRAEYQRVDGYEELSAEAREWYDRFAAPATESQP